MHCTIRTASGKTLFGTTRFFLLCVGIYALYLISSYSYLLFHSRVEILGIILLGGIFVLAWHGGHPDPGPDRQCLR
jgi:hypothetical protein